MKDRSYVGKIDRWQSTLENIQGVVPNIPGVDEPLAVVREKVTALRAAHDALVMMEGRRKEIVIVRRQLDREAERAIRRLASLARGHLGFDNPVLETFGVRSEDPARRRRRATKAQAGEAHS